MFIELHAIQSFAPSNLNRDDTNNPKDCLFGGARRARISSQCIKRAIRREPIFHETTRLDLGVRTKLIATKCLEPLFVDAGKEAKTAREIALAVAKAYAGKMDGEKTSVLTYLSPAEIQYIASRVLEQWDAILNDNSLLDQIIKSLIKETKGRTHAPDIALFGRMLADKPDLSLDAACQVAHAISTHAISMEMDFYTAVDDLQPEGEVGAGMMGFTSFNSATFYRYMRIDWGQLVRNLMGDTDLARRTTKGFMQALVSAIPTGKQNAFAAQNPPDFLLAVVRTGGTSWSLANAFEKPVPINGLDGLVGPSIKALDQYWGNLVRIYGQQDITLVSALSLRADSELVHLAEYLTDNLKQWISSVLQALPQE